jgi:hypothetical protein
MAREESGDDDSQPVRTRTRVRPAEEEKRNGRYGLRNNINSQVTDEVIPNQRSRRLRQVVHSGETS